MRITDSTMVLQSSFASVSYERTEASVESWCQPVEVSVSDEAKPNESKDLKTWLKQLLLEAFTGRKLDEVEERDEDKADKADKPGTRRHGAGPPPGQMKAGVEIHFEHLRYEAEAVKVSAAGVVSTGDGRQLAVSLQVGMQREHFERLTVDVAYGDKRPIDPLVINLSAATTALGQARISFDLDADGDQEDLAAPAAGSGFLALDRNGDGVVTDGRELFGPQSGDGFAELAALDQDGDGWIDEDDQAWSELRIWEPSAGRLSTLAESGVGAIFTGSAVTPFTLGQSSADAEALVRSTGLYLREDGGAGTVQQIDYLA